MMLNIQSHNPDILNCLANLSSDEIFTPPELANQILDKLPAKLFRDPSTRFLDPCSKSGVFLREIAKRLKNGLADKFPDESQKISHIYHNQLFGIATTELCSLISRRTVYCSKKANGDYSVSSGFNDEQGNIRFRVTSHDWRKSGRREFCEYCGISKSSSDREEDFESYAYEFIHHDNPEEIFNMKFDVILGNPPYQLTDGGFGRSAKPIYQMFVDKARKLDPEHLIMIIPSRWFGGGKGLDDFRKSMLNDKRIKRIVDYPDANDCFPRVDIAGGVCYFHWEKDYSGQTEVENHWKGKFKKSKRWLNEFDTFVRFNLAADIIKKVGLKGESTMDTMVSSRKPFGLATNVIPQSGGNLNLISHGGEGKFPEDQISTGRELIPKWKVLTSKVSHDHAGNPDKHGMRRVLSKLLIASPQTICTETYLIAGSFENKEEAENLEHYLKLKFTRFLIAQRTFSHDITKDRFTFVPILNWNKKYSDEELYDKYDLSDEEANFIESSIKAMK